MELKDSPCFSLWGKLCIYGLKSYNLMLDGIRLFTLFFPSVTERNSYGLVDLKL